MAKEEQRLFRSAPVEKDGRVLVRSTCVACGYTMIGSVAEDLLEQQQQHIESAHAEGTATSASD